MSPLAARVPRQPITFMYGNLVWGPFSDEVWAVYALEMHSYEGRPRRGKIDLMGDLADAANGLEADFQLLRISRQWSLEDYAAGADATVDARHGHPAEWRAVIDAQRGRWMPNAHVLLCVSGRGDKDVAHVSAEAGRGV